MKKLEAYNEMIKNTDSFLNKKGSFMVSRFIRSNYENIEEILERGFQLKEITENLSHSLNIDVNYASFWVSMKRHSERIKSKKNPEKETFKKENVVTERKKLVSNEIKDTEKKPDLEWIKKPEFEHINRDQIIDIITEYGITEQEVIDLKLPLYTLKCLDILISYGEKKKSEEIGKLYFGN